MITGFRVLEFQIYTDFRARFGPSGVYVVNYGLVHSSKKTIDKTEKEDFTKAKNFYMEAVWMMKPPLIVRQLTLFCTSLALFEGNVATSY